MKNKPNSSSKKIVVVEDDEDIRLLYQEILTSEGFDVEVAENGEAALRILNSLERLPCLILTDFMMPGINGSQLVKLLRMNDLLISIPVVMISARPLTDLEIKDVEFLKKPIDVDTIIQKVKEYCGPYNTSCLTHEEKKQHLQDELT